ncbi:MAG TPA: hypothetical protein VLA29_13485 [Acidimicrobiia bacterium]|nr:hypothetical protein [Acidimicrobiia bacterium]
MIALMSSASRAILILLIVLLASCSDGGSRIEAPTPSGRTLDCPDELIAYSVSDLMEEVMGADTAQEALDALPDPDRPRGESVVEEQSPDEIVFLFVDNDENRVGRVGVGSRNERGWFITWQEKCGTE